MELTTTVTCDSCNMESTFFDDSKDVEPCPWCGENLETGWIDSDD